MAGFSALDEQINALNALHIGGAKTLESFADTSKAIADRARRIAADVQPWEVAQENIASTIKEMSRAARCYHPPPALRLVLARKEKNPEVLCKCIDYLVFTDNYLASHPTNLYADQIGVSIAAQLATMVEVAEDTVKEAFIKSLQKKELWQSGEGEKREAATAPATPEKASVLIHDNSALRGIDQIVHRLGENFNRNDVVSLDVKELLAEGMLRLVDALCGSSHKEEEMQPYAILPARHEIAPMRKHYQKGCHRLLGISSTARQIVSEAGECLQQYVLEPLDDAFDVVGMPGELATLVFDRVMSKCFAAVEVNDAALANPTLTFVLSRGEGVGLVGETHHYRDAIFIGLDLLEELWKWKSLAESLPGENHVFIDHVDSEVEQFLFEVRDLLDAYVTCKGALDAKLLKEYTNALHRTEWVPSLDCSTHVSVTNQVYLHKVMLTHYFGALKLALHGTLLNTSSEVEALQEVEDYMMRCVLGTLRDLEVIAEAALELQSETMNHAGRRRHRRQALSFSPSRVQRYSSERGHVISPDIFLLNNILFLVGSYRKEACFHQRRLPTDDPESSRQKSTAELPSVPIVANIIAVLEDEKGRYVDEFAASWAECFPAVSGNPCLASITTESGELRKAQRMAVKHWYKAVADALAERIYACRTFAVLDKSQRNLLIEASVAAVRNGFATFEARLGGRAWSTRPMKWMRQGVEQWAEELSKAF
ncbi:uncharacterized protein Tco025E_04269 [Trypanosoma conorhini]|uniref:Exocyst subunit Exo70 family protein n=1 Tax=Trypanosoma conorhini TaxID=83891 RepID=A0A422PMK7_9TRYP|nr:uncharacterized protein Tco025E_04269 [Trypanosoma conorhini]RNF18940.1 hypothetical protein Tco025E_04269 [Trypanosoma conorhini]